ncbi:hypothetical protein GLOIN_2v1482691 [Rhizophagus clarus]|uniref:Uncharacterized protein n=1 Tax=Rhizophagus clarus TaxID=94130 RepID=A0A8H3M400_9GLOM|nr:hypothetical protein GLOIN_2v1482691 [Rhizophagus clarus]
MRRGGFKRLSGIIYEEAPKSHVGYDEKNRSYRGFLESNRKVIIASIFSEEESDLDRYWAFNFLKEAKHKLNDKDFILLKTKVEQERRGNGLKPYWENIIQEYKVKEPNSPSLPKKAKREQKETEYKSVVKTQYKRGSSSDNEKDIDPVGYESMEERYNKEPTRVILKLEIIIEQNKI